MRYYFNIADIRICMESEIEVAWNSYISAFLCAPEESYDEYYECECVDVLPCEGELLYRDQFQMVFGNGEYEERLHFFWGQDEPCMLYKEYEEKKVIYLNRRFMESFLREDNYSIFNAMAFEKVLMKHRGVVLHSSFIIWEGQAILFTAPSGTGKSTQAMLWEKCRGAVIANGDRTILKMKNGQVYAYGMPICGSSDICRNVTVPVRAIIYLSQAMENQIEEMDLKQRIKKLISEITINFFDRNFLETAMEMIAEIAEHVDMYHYSCTKEERAVDVLEDRLKEKEHGSNKAFKSYRTGDM
ncbi:MAG: hypothetical protein Q4C52_08735 [Eubacteriales bacterium]|nr:hypothetical protein [Eubacteriales bacterium]